MFFSCQKPVTLDLELVNNLDKIAIQDVPKGAPGIATGVVMNGEIVYEKYEGYANLEDSTLIDEQSRFNIASNGKQFTALAILLLIEEGKLSLDDDFRKFVPELYTDITTTIKIKHLLNHSSGIRDVYDLWSLQGLTWWEHTFSNKDALNLLAKQKDLNFEPGTKHSYSNSNYILLSEIVGKVSGMSFIAYTNSMFQSLNMPNTSFVDNYKTISGEIARPYFNFDTWFGYEWIWNINGDGNIFSTLKDQLEWERIVQNQKNDAVSSALIEKSQALVENSTIDTYGYGLEFGEHKSIPYAFHGGATGAWKAISARFSEQSIAVITLTNSGKTDPMMQTLQTVDALLGLDKEDSTFPITPAEVGEYVSVQDVLGIYRTELGYVMRFVERDGALYMQRSGRNDIKLLREADNVFHQWNDAPFKQEFTKNEEGKMQITAYYPTVAPFSLTRIESDLSNFDFDVLNGAYQNLETEVSFTISYINDRNFILKMGDRELNGILVTPYELLVNDYQLTFELKDTKGLSEIMLTSGRIQNVKFERQVD
ncbi:MAG: serine hydrolase [Saprospiraceae bacterium]|nr:serine hydrolase [Saprospiraceae bacterium]